MEWKKAAITTVLAALCGCEEPTAPSMGTPVVVPSDGERREVAPQAEEEAFDYGYEPTSLASQPATEIPAFLDLGVRHASLAGAVGDVADRGWDAQASRGVGWNPGFASFLVDAEGEDGFATVGIDIYANNLLHVLTPNSYVRVGEGNDYEITLSGGRNEDETPADLGRISIEVQIEGGQHATAYRHLDTARTVEFSVYEGDAQHEMLGQFMIETTSGQLLSASFGFFPAECSWGVQP